MQLASLPQIGPSTTANGASPSGSTASSPVPSAAAGASTQSAVTIDLSAAAVAALAAQTSPSANAAAPTSAPADGVDAVPAIVRQAQQLAGVIADGSTASNAEKGAALAGLYKLRFSDPKGSSSTAWFAQSTQAQRDQINNAVDKSTFFKQAVGAAIQFNADGMAAAKTGQSTDSSQTAYDRFNRLSADQQVLVWAGGASQFASPQQYSAHLGLQAAGVASTAPTSSAAGSTPPQSASGGQAYKSGQTGAQGSVVSLIA